MNKKGQGLPLNTIVIALLVVIVLVVLILAFTTNIGDTNRTFQEMSGECSIICSAFGNQGQILSEAQAQTCSMPTQTLRGGENCCCGQVQSRSVSVGEETIVGNVQGILFGGGR